MNIERGFRGKMSDFADLSQPVIIRLYTTGNAVYDTCCFGVDASDRISDDRYTVFYNQPLSPSGEITYTQNGYYSDYQVFFGSLPSDVTKLVFTVSIDGNGTMGQIGSHSAELIQNGNVIFSLNLSGNSFRNEKAIIDFEIYLKSEWRISAVARGFDGGLDDLVRSYGGVIAEQNSASQQTYGNQGMSNQYSGQQTYGNQGTPNQYSGQQTYGNQGMSNQYSGQQTYGNQVAPNQYSAQQSQSVSAETQMADKLMNKISLSKDKVKLEKHVISLSKCVVDLSKKSGVDLGNIRARVAVAIDYSGSMSSLYRKGVVQRTINRLVPLGLTFDDNGSIDLYLFQNDYRKFPDLDLTNYEYYVDEIINASDYSMGGTHYSPVLKGIINGESGFGHSNNMYQPSGGGALVNDWCPTFILFITDGENSDRIESNDIIMKSSQMNVFIQFIGIGNERFTYLQSLDDLPGRMRDNTGFLKMADLDRVGDDVLYSSVLDQFSKWLRGMQ